jgi:uncharacterized FlgJ-related protein
MLITKNGKINELKEYSESEENYTNLLEKIDVEKLIVKKN